MNGNGQEVIKFYENALDAEVVGIQTFREMPHNPEFPIPVGAKDCVLNPHLKVGDTNLMLSDTLPGQPCPIELQVTVTITIDNVEKSKDVFGKLKEGGQVERLLKETFWSPLYGQISEKPGISWQISTQVANNK